MDERDVHYYHWRYPQRFHLEKKDENEQENNEVLKKRERKCNSRSDSQRQT